MYDSSKNIIYYADESVSLSTKGHEFLHLASNLSDIKNKLYIFGFGQSKGIAYIGTGLTEGYTELLATRLYNPLGKIDSYLPLVKITELLEEFFEDKKELAHYYFTCDLPRFIHYMEKFCSREEIIKIILEMDSIYEYIFSPLSKVPILKECFISLKLLDLYTKYQKDNPEKIAKFKTKVCRNKLANFLLKIKDFKLEHNRSFEVINNMSKENRTR